MINNTSNNTWDAPWETSRAHFNPQYLKRTFFVLGILQNSKRDWWFYIHAYSAMSCISSLPSNQVILIYCHYRVGNMTLKPGFRYANHIDICINNNTVYFVNFRCQWHDIRKEKRGDILRGRSWFNSRYFRNRSLTLNGDQIIARLPGQSSRTKRLSKIIWGTQIIPTTPWTNGRDSLIICL